MIIAGENGVHILYSVRYCTEGGGPRRAMNPAVPCGQGRNLPGAAGLLLSPRGCSCSPHLSVYSIPARYNGYI